MSFDIGDEVLLTWPLTDTDGTPQDATTVVLTVTAPDGTISTPTVAHPSTGTYTATVTPDSAGMWGFRWQATGSGVAAEDGAFLVRRQGVERRAVADGEGPPEQDPSQRAGGQRDPGHDRRRPRRVRGVHRPGVGDGHGKVFDGGGDTLVLRQPVNAITAASYDSGDTLTYTDLTVSNGIVRWGYGTAGGSTTGG
jgi:hypothetical protein